MSKGDEKDENGMGEPNAATRPDPIPPVHVLEAAADQDKKETEDLLAGFDRPGRGPKKPEGERDFVEYFAKKKGTPTPPPVGVRPAAAAQPARPKQVDIATVVVPRDKKPVLAPWLIAGAVMLVLGGAVAFLATRTGDDANARKTAGVGATTTTITNASPPPSTRSSHDDIPPPPPASEVAPTTDPPSGAPSIEPATASGATASGASRSSASAAPSGSGAKKRDPKGAGSSGASGGAGAAPNGTTPVTSTGAPMVAPSSKPPPRDDLIRGM